ncbi:Uncharacterised protein [Klebsiella pneumoniae]|nr:Uncharacterised protein [Klebsiella pneumoniae]
MTWERRHLTNRTVCQRLDNQRRTAAFEGHIRQLRTVRRPGWRHQWLRGAFHQELVVAIVVRYAQFVRELTTVGLHHVRDTGTERAFNAGQFFKYRIAGSVCRVAQVLLSDLVRVLGQNGTWCTAGIHQLPGHVVRTVRIRGNLTHNHGINTQCRPCCRLHFLRATRLLRQARTI